METVTLFDSRHNYLEIYLYNEDVVGLHLESDQEESAFTVEYTLDELRQLQATIGHVLWLADNVEVD